MSDPPAPERSPVKSRRQEHVEQTRRALIDCARGLFAEHGYSAVSIDSIVGAARVTKGALYHHFADKRDLFRTVFAEVEHELVQRVRRQSGTTADPWRELELACEAFLVACLDADTQRIVFIDAPVVLGWDEWRTADAGSSIELLSRLIERAITAGEIEPTRPVSLAHLLLGALNEAGMMIAASRDKRRARSDVQADLRRILNGLRIASSGP